MRKLLYLIGLLFIASIVFMACNNDEPEIYVPNNDEGIVINGIRWATRNVNVPGTFTNRPEDAGMLFQWNRRQGWTSTGEVTDWNNSNPTGTNWESENDPCPPGWRVPTEEELKSLAFYAPSIGATLNGAAGRIFGTAPNHIFLPAAGWRFSFENGVLSDAGMSGVYWSSTQSERDTNARLFRFSSARISFNPNENSSRNMPISIKGIGSTSRASASSVRCVAE